MVAAPSSGRTPTPLCLYVLWHPACEAGPVLARSIYEWFHAPTEDLHRSGLGLPVYFRSAAFEPSATSPRPIDLEGADVNLIVPLVDEHMVADDAWRRYLDELAKQVGTQSWVKSTQLYPTALHPSAYRLSAPIRRVNYLHVQSREDPSDLDAAERVRRWAVRLRRSLTEVVSRHLRGFLAQTLYNATEAPPVTVFLSHAKADGTPTAEAIREEIYRYGQIQAFFDESDLPIGSPFAPVLWNAAETGTAAMLSVVTDAYASRPWCREEIRAARTPCSESNDGSKTPSWFIHPLVAVQALGEGRTRGIPELGNVPTVQWRPGAATEILDLVLLETLLNAFHRLSARRIPPKAGRHVLTWVPDHPTLMELSCKLRGLEVEELVYPGHGLPAYERLAYQRFLGDSVKLLTFEEASK